MDYTGLIIVVIKCVFVMLFLLQMLPLLIWGERKGAAYIQDRPGPNRADIFGIRLAGLVHTLTDVVKLLFKEDITPRQVYQPFYKIAPIIAMTVSLITFVVVPFGDVLYIGDRAIPLQVAALNSGLLYVLAIGSLGVYGIMLAGWSSNNKYALLGGLRSSAQMISYEISMSLAVAVMFLLYGTAQLDVIVHGQTANPLNWGVVSVPGFIAFIMFATASFAETNRLPFDLPEGESELVAGYHVEYSAFKFAMFFMAEYVNMVVASGIMVTLFFGGYQVPFLSTETLMNHAPLITKVLFGGGAVAMIVGAVIAFRSYIPGRYGDNRDQEPRVVGLLLLGMAAGSAALAFVPGLLPFIPSYEDRTMASIAAALIQFTFFAAKVLFFCWVFIWVRWTLPRFRYDQLMRLGWNYLLPLGIANLVVAGVWTLLFPDGGPLTKLGF
jgi:NADH-quinone oxidoreductase subunit H